MYKKILLSLIIGFGSVLYAATDTRFSSDISSKDVAFRNLQSINFSQIQSNSVLPKLSKKKLESMLRSIFKNPVMTKEKSFLILKDCSNLLLVCRVELDEKFKVDQRHPETGRQQKADFIEKYAMEELWLIRNLVSYAASLYYEGAIPEGILDIKPDLEWASDTYLTHLKTECGSVFFIVPFSGHEEKTTFYFSEFVVSERKTLMSVQLLYNGNNAIHESGFYLDLDQAEVFALGAYLGSPIYKMADKHLLSKSLNPDMNSLTADIMIKNLLEFVVNELGKKIGGLQNLVSLRNQGELVFFPFPIIQKEQEEAAYAEDLFQAELAIKNLSTFSFLLENIPEQVDDVDKQKENLEKRKIILEKKRKAEELLARRSHEYNVTQDALIATIEGKLLALNEAKYIQKIQDEQAKIRSQLEERSKAGIMAGKKLTAAEKGKIKESIELEKQQLQQRLDEVTHQVRSKFLEDIKGRHKERQHVLKAFHDLLIKNDIPFYETQSGSHRVTHTDGAAPVTVVEEHKGTSEFSGKTIRKMLDVFSSAIRKHLLKSV